MKEREQQCLRCKHKWKARIVKPIACPKCKRYDWFKKKEGEDGKEK